MADQKTAIFHIVMEQLMVDLFMQTRRLKLYLVIALICLCVTAPASADVRILLDVSKSMAENDPQNNRTTAIVSLAQSIPNGEKVGVWTFGQYVNLLMPHEPINNAWRNNNATKLKQLTAPAIRTNIGRVLEEAAYDFHFPSYQRDAHIVLISDGKVDIAPNTEVNQVERDRILTQLVPRYVAANAKIHTIALSDDADHELLRQLSGRTGGNYQTVTSDKSFSKAMGQITGEVVPSIKIARSKSVFDVSQGVKEVTVIIKHNTGAVSVVSPAGIESSAVKPNGQQWHVGAGYSQVTVSSPEFGVWEVKGSINTREKIQVLTDVSLHWILPINDSVARSPLLSISTILRDKAGNEVALDLRELISAQLTVSGKPVAVNITQNEIQARIIPPSDSDQLMLEIKLDGKTFTRLAKRQLNLNAVVTTELLTLADRYEWRLYPSALLSDDAEFSPKVVLEKNGQQTQENFVKESAGYWSWSVPFDEIGEQSKATLTGSYLVDGQSKAIPTEEIVLTMPSGNQVPDTELVDDTAITDPLMLGDFVKDPMPSFAELQADITVQQDGQEWSDETDPADSGEGLGMGTVLLLTVPAILFLVVAYLVYSRIEQKAKLSASEDEMLLGGDEFAGLDDMASMAPDTDLDLSGFDDHLPDAPMIDDIQDDLPPPLRTEAPSAAQEDMLDEQTSARPAEPEEAVTESDEELFDISSIDDDLADLDLALDGDDPFVDAENNP